MKGKIFTAVIILICGGILASLLWKNEQNEQAAAVFYEEMNTLLHPLETEKAEMEQELEQLEKEQEDEEFVEPTLEFLFLTPTVEVYEEAWPELKERGMTAMAALSAVGFPGADHMMTGKQYLELLKDGWQICLAWDGEGSLEKWLGQMESLVTGEELATGLDGVPVYIPEGSWEESYDALLLSYGCTAAILQDSEAPITAEGFTEEQLWRPGAFLWQGSSGSTVVNLLTSSGGNLVYAMDWTTNRRAFTPDQFEVMLDTCQNYVESGDLTVTSLDVAAEQYLDTGNPDPDTEETYQARRKELEAQIEEIEEEIRNVREQYREEHQEE